jgi:hypothetical protein
LTNEEPTTVEDERAEKASWKAHTLVQKWHDPADYEAGLEPDEVVEEEGNLLLNAGITRLLNLAIGAGGQAFTNGVTRLGVGNGATAATAGDTDLAAAAGAGNRLFHIMDATYPQVAGQTMTFRATYQDAEANFVWAEWGIDQGGAGGNTAVVVAPMLNRRVVALGTKLSGVWTLTVTVTIS